MKKQKKMFRKGTEDAGKTSAYSKIRRIKAIMNQWDFRYTGPAAALDRIKNILED